MTNTILRDALKAILAPIESNDSATAKQIRKLYAAEIAQARAALAAADADQAPDAEPVAWMIEPTSAAHPSMRRDVTFDKPQPNKADFTVTPLIRFAPGFILMPAELSEPMVHAAEDVPAPRPYGAVYRAFVAARPATVGAVQAPGWQMVPKVPTEEMIAAYVGEAVVIRLWDNYETEPLTVDIEAKMLHSAMLAAAPAAPIGETTKPVMWALLSECDPQATVEPLTANYWECKGRKVTPLYDHPAEHAKPEPVDSHQPAADSHQSGADSHQVEPVEQAEGSEREQFEAWARKECEMPPNVPVNWAATWVQSAWEGWQARGQQAGAVDGVRT